MSCVCFKYTERKAAFQAHPLPFTGFVGVPRDRAMPHLGPSPQRAWFDRVGDARGLVLEVLDKILRASL
jgi:hypothetical protein